MDELFQAKTRELLWDGSVEVLCFGAPENWALRGLSEEANEDFNPGVTGRLRTLLGRHRVGRLYLPSPNFFNAELVAADALWVPWTKNVVFRGKHAEGVLLDKIGDAVGIASSDCPTIIARNRASLLAVAAHAGRESLYDKAAIFDGAPLRQYASVVDAIVAALAPGHRGIDGITAHVSCGISVEVFSHPTSHPKNGERNAALVRYFRDRWGASCVSDDGLGRIDLFEVIAAQFADLGIKRTALTRDSACTYEDTSLARGYTWHSHRREGDGKRNFVLIVRRR
jgi:copper oxidase (laccase) domain-containing protein